MILSTATPESPLLFQCVFIFGRRRSPTANLTVLPAGPCQKQIWAPLAAGWNNACTWVQRRKHDKKQTSVQTKVWCQTPSLSNSQTSWKAILQLWLYQGSDHTHRNSTHSGSFTAAWIFIQFMNCIGRKGTEQFLDELPWALASKRQRYLHTFSLNSSISKIRA